jgi:hypothetical protein
MESGPQGVPNGDEVAQSYRPVDKPGKRRFCKFLRPFVRPFRDIVIGTAGGLHLHGASGGPATE